MRPKPPRTHVVVVAPPAAPEAGSRLRTPEGRYAGFEAGDPRRFTRRFYSQNHPVSPTRCPGLRLVYQAHPEPEASRPRISRRPFLPGTSTDGTGDRPWAL